jgi:uncharacterized protein (TIGR00725 family)
MAVIGAGGALDGATETMCAALGELAVDAGFRIATGGLGGVMEAVSRGAHRSASYREGDVVGILPTYDRQSANSAVDIVIPTGLGIARNVVLVSSADVVVAVGGGSGTLSEIAVAWQLGKPIVALAAVPGWAADLADRAIDDRRADRIASAATPAEAISLARSLT